jgi:pullulanase/glycogen debranching enzyme
MDWSPEPREERMRAFVAGALRLRRQLPLLGSPHWLRGDPVAEGGLPGVRWLRPDGEAMAQEDWTNGHGRALMVALAEPEGDGVLMLSNAAHEPVDFVLPATGSKARWRLRLDSADGRIDPEEEALAEGAEVSVPERSIRLYSL